MAGGDIDDAINLAAKLAPQHQCLNKVTDVVKLARLHALSCSNGLSAETSNDQLRNHCLAALVWAKYIKRSQDDHRGTRLYPLLHPTVQFPSIFSDGIGGDRLGSHSFHEGNFRLVTV